MSYHVPVCSRYADKYWRALGENCSRNGVHCEGYDVPNLNGVSLASATGSSLETTGTRPIKLLPKRSDRYKQSNELARSISSIEPLMCQEYTQASGVAIPSEHMETSNLEILSEFASNRSQEQSLSNNGVPIDSLSVTQYHNHTIPSIQHLLRDLDAGRDMESTAHSRERDTLLGGNSRADAAG